MSLRLNVVAVLALVLPLASPAPPAELKPHTLEAFLSYATATESRFLAEVATDDPFLYIDRLSGAARDEALAGLMRGEVLMERLKTKAADGSEIKIKDGLIHHWVGTVFIPGATLEDTLALLQDYNRHAEIYAPQVEQARIVDRDGDNFTVFYRFRKKKILTAVHNTTHEADYYRRGPTHAYSISKSTRIREVQNPGEPDEKELPEDNNRGLLWAINSYWKLLEMDGGTFVESESVSLTRSIPILAVPIVRPFVTGVPRELLAFTLENTRNQLASWTLSVTKSGTGTGAVSSSPAGIDCGDDCSEPYAESTVVTLTTVPAPGSSFGGWTGDCAADGTVTMDAAKSCDAQFDQIFHKPLPDDPTLPPYGEGSGGKMR